MEVKIKSRHKKKLGKRKINLQNSHWHYRKIKMSKVGDIRKRILGHSCRHDDVIKGITFNTV